MPSSYAGMNIEQLRLCAKEGDTEAQFLLGVRLLAVRGGAMEGTEHLKTAAKKRHLQACERLGSVYLYGEGGVPQDKKQATVYYEQAFALGSVTARTRLAELYLEDEEKAPRGLKLLTDMAQAGDKAAATRAARLFLSGEVSGVDFERAATYANLSEDSAVLYEAAEKLDTLGVNPELRDELYRKLMEKDREGARLSPSTLITMSRMYRLGKGVKQDGRSAERLLKRAVELEGQQAMTEPRAELALAELYETGAAGLPADHAAARGLLKSLYKEGSEVARVRYVRLCTADGRYLDAYCALAEAKQYQDALGYVLEHWDAIPDQAAFVQRAFLFAEAAQREQPGLRALRDELYRRQRLAGMPADQVLAFALKKGDAQGALTFFSALDDADKSLIYQNREVCASVPAARPDEPPACAQLRALLGEVPQEIRRWEELLLRLRACTSAPQRWEFAQAVLADLPAARAGEARQLTALRKALEQVRQPEETPAPAPEEEPAYAAMRSRLRALPEQSEERARYARECLADLPPERAGEASALAELRQALLEASTEERPAPPEEEDAYAAMRSRLRALPEQSEERARYARECLAVLPPERAGEASSLAGLRQALVEASAEQRPAPPEEEGRAYFAMLSRFRRLPRLGSARAQYAGETLSRLPERREGEPEALTRLRQELAACLDAQQRAEDPTAVATPDRPEVDVDGLRAALEALDAEPAKALRCAIETLNGLPPQKEGEGQALTAFREELWEYLRQRWGAFASAFAKKSGDSAKAVRQAQSFASNFLAPAKPLYEGAPCKEFDAICAAVERILSRKEEERQARERKRTAWARKAEAFQPDPQDVARLPAVTRALSALPARQEGEEEGLTAYRALLEQEQRDIATRLEAGLAACASTAERRRFAAENRDYVLFALPAGAPCGRQMQELRRKFAAAAAGRETIWEQRLEGVLKAPSDAARISLLSELAGELPAPLAGEDPALTQLRTLCAGMEWKQRLEAFNLLTDEAKKSAFARGPLGVLPEKQKGEDATLSILRSLLTPYQEGNDVKPQRADNVSQQAEGEWTPVPQEAAKPKKRGRARRALLAALIIAAIGACGLFAWQLFVAWRGAGAHDLVSPTQSAGQVQPTPFHANRLTQLQPVEVPSRYYIDRWTNTAYMGDFMALIGDEARQVSGIGWFVPSSSIDSKEEGAQGQVSAAYDLGGQYKKLTFLVSSDQVWTDGAQAGTYNLAVATDGETVYETGWCDHTTSLTDITVDLTGCQRLTFTLTQRRGSKGTLNIVMGELALE